MFIRSGYSAQIRNWGSLGTDGHHLAAAVVPGGRDCLAAGRSQAGSPRLAQELGRRQPIEADRVVLDRVVAVGRDGLASALEHHAAVGCAHRRRPAGIHDAIALAHVWEWLGPAL